MKVCEQTERYGPDIFQPLERWELTELRMHRQMNKSKPFHGSKEIGRERL